MYYIASCSCGKDSLAMVYRLIEDKLPLNEIVFYDTGMEFETIYDNWNKLKNHAENRGIKCTKLEPQCPFSYTMFEKPVNVGKPNEHKGYSWCGGVCRWGTTEKLKALDKYCQERNAMCYIGIATDEARRLTKYRKPYKIFPLVEWNMTENDCLTYCRQIGINWIEHGFYAIINLLACHRNLFWLYLKFRHQCQEPFFSLVYNHF